MSRTGCVATIVILAVGGTAWCFFNRERALPPGVVVAQSPLQGPVPPGEPAQFSVADYRVKPLASYSIRARVMSRENYWLGHAAQLCPVDLALGWGRMSDWNVYHRLNIKQRGRFYLYSWGAEGPPIPRGEITTHSANNHLIPANDEVARTLKAVRAGDVIRINGDLVEARDAEGHVWRSSLSREDTGGGSCELIYVKDLTIEPADMLTASTDHATAASGR